MRGRRQFYWFTGEIVQGFLSIVEKEVDFSSDRYFKLQGLCLDRERCALPKVLSNRECSYISRLPGS